MTATPPRMRLPGMEGLRVAVTAGGSGIGLAIARELKAQGARLAICDVDAAALDSARAELGAEVADIADVSDPDQVGDFFANIKATMGGLDALVNNAGIAGPTGGVEDIDHKDWARCIDVCLTGQFLCAHHAVPMLKAAGGGSIVSMSSAAGRFGYAYRTPYAAAKWGVIGLTQSLAKELGSANIRVNAILPGIIEGPRIEGVIADRARQTGVSHEEMKDDYIRRISLRRMTPPEDVADIAAFLISDAGRNLSGQSFPVDGNVEAL
ncbi:SDR family oxidoreductase [Sedimentitalea todarodis]|uniref:SDR family oxidoreductase n=1 Tax=Sedimentitalea todarodis TaxID=1631240 RepID=A0ABU3VEL3_9RHOB|nr:SDR family oxidoreductase [Sedimentitalea todarodis]MDU9004528.1 SDR family oxidoreductase [Sedimentitalea todarodis]